MLTLGILDKLCITPDEAMMTSAVLRVRKKSKEDDDYFGTVFIKTNLIFST
jgi:hypothetical protein